MMTDQTQTQDPTQQTVQVATQTEPVPAQTVAPTTPVAPIPPTQTPAPAPVQPVGFFGKVKNFFSKFGAMADVAGKTLQTGANVLGGVAQTAINVGTSVGEGVGNAVQNNQGGNILQNITGGIQDVAKTTVNAGMQAGSGIVEAGKQAATGVVDAGKGTLGTVSNVAADIPVGGSVFQGIANTVENVADKAVNITENVADKAVNVGSGAVTSVQNFGENAFDKVSTTVESATSSVSEKIADSKIGQIWTNVINQTTNVVQDLTKVPTGVQEGENQQPLYILNPNGDIIQAPETPTEQQNLNGEIPISQPSTPISQPNEGQTLNNTTTTQPQ